jgi:hypothetical protein
VLAIFERGAEVPVLTIEDRRLAADAPAGQSRRLASRRSKAYSGQACVEYAEAMARADRTEATLPSFRRNPAARARSVPARIRPTTWRPASERHGRARTAGGASASRWEAAVIAGKRNKP